MSKSKSPDELRAQAVGKIEKAMKPLSDAMRLLGEISASPEATSEQGVEADVMLTDLTKAYGGLFEIICPRAAMDAWRKELREQGRL